MGLGAWSTPAYIPQHRRKPRFGGANLCLRNTWSCLPKAWLDEKGFFSFVFPFSWLGNDHAAAVPASR